MIESALTALGESEIAQAFAASRYVYPIVNALHILGLATLFGAILALDLRLLGMFSSVPAQPIARMLPRVAATGLSFAIVTGLFLFSVEPLDYAANSAFLVKVALVALGIVHAASVHVSSSWHRLFRDGGLIDARLRISAFVSLSIWTAAIVAGRFIAF